MLQKFDEMNHCVTQSLIVGFGGHCSWTQGGTALTDSSQITWALTLPFPHHDSELQQQNQEQEKTKRIYTETLKREAPRCWRKWNKRMQKVAVKAWISGGVDVLQQLRTGLSLAQPPSQYSNTHSTRVHVHGAQRAHYMYQTGPLVKAGA